ncbi:MAG: ABC transporter substrate-binding protein [Candidatus Tectomicrobia bacterium]|nr:ABC transporter substrate-binding protein [Candidatus Tectomicrobia bacterium]
MGRRVLFVLVLLLSLSVALAAAQAQSGAKQKVRFSEVVRSLGYTPQYVALSNGYFGDEGLEIEFRTAWGGGKSLSGLITKQDEIALLGPEVTYYATEQGVPDPVLTFAQLTQRDVTFLVARKGQPPFTWAGLKGKTVLTTSPGVTPHMVFLWVLAKHGLQPGKDVMVTPLSSPTLAPAFMEGRGDYAALWEVGVTQVEKMGIGTTVASLGLEGGLLAYTTYAALASYIKAHPDIIQKFTNAIYKGMRWTDAHSSKEIAEAIKSYYDGVAMDILVTALERYRKQQTWRSDPIISDEATNALQDILVFNKALKKQLPIEKVNIHGFGEKAVETAKLKK